MYREALTSCRRFSRMSFWIVAVVVALPVSPVFAQKKGKPSPPPLLANSAIVYIAGDTLKVADADGSNQASLFTDRFAHFDAPSWAPDGNKIIFRGDMDGGGIYQITIDRSTGQIGAPQKMVAHSGDSLKPKWSPVPTVNGNFMIAYEDYPDSAPGSVQSDIWLFDPQAPTIAGINPFNLTNTPDISELSPSWSPDATKLVVKTHVNNDANSPSDVEILSLAGCGVNGPSVCEVAPRRSLVQQVQGSPLISAHPIMNTSWANTGNEIALSALISPDGNHDIWVIEFDDTGVQYKNLTKTNSADPPDRQEARPTWSPRDAQIMYQGWDYLCQPQSNKKRGYNLIIRNVDGTDFLEACEEKMVIEGGGDPDWWRNAPLGKALLGTTALRQKNMWLSPITFFPFREQ